MPRPPLPPGPYLVVGLARSGVAAALALRAARPGEQVVATDYRPAGAACEGLEQAGVEVHLESDGTHILEASPPPATLVKSPGVPQDAPVVERARRQGLEVIGELELGWRLVPNEFIAVTGTNGKTTTVELIGAMHRAAGAPVAVAGNVGTPVSSLAGSVDPAATIVCEASSFQLEDSVAFAPEVAVLLNIAPITSTGTARSRTTATPSCASSPTRIHPTSRWCMGRWTSPPLGARTVRIPAELSVQPRERGGGRDGVHRARASTPKRCGPRCGSSPACRIASKPSASLTASPT